jgi:putative flippase GtrA
MAPFTARSELKIRSRHDAARDQYLTVRQNPVRGAQPVSTVTAVSVDVKVDRRTFLLSLISWETVRYAISGSSSTLTYIALTLLVSGPLGVPIQLAIPVSYASALVLNFTLQRHFVFPAQGGFVLGRGSQLRRYIVAVLVQYGVTATSTAVLPHLLGVPETDVYVVTVLILAVCAFLTLRSFVFHSNDE